MAGAGSRLPELDLARIRRWCEARVPDHVRDKLHVDYDVTDRAVTIVECRPPWQAEAEPEWTRTPVARLRYTRSRGEWSLYWADRNSSFHRYGLARPTASVQNLLAEIDRDPTCIFWG